MQKILITGGTGLIGSALSQRLIKAGHSVCVLTRQKRLHAQYIDGIHFLNELNTNDNFDIVINLAGEPIANKRWSAKQKQVIWHSRIDTTQTLISHLETCSKKPEVFINASAIGFYGIARGDQDINEKAQGDISFSSQLCSVWENTARQVEELGIRCCLLRTGIVLSKEGGVLRKLLPSYQIGLGGPVGDGKQWMPWIHIEDMLNIIEFCINTKNLNGPINCVAPNIVDNKEFSKILARNLRRPDFFRLPRWVVELVFGQMGVELLLSGKKVRPEYLANTEFSFQYTELDKALSNILK